MNKNFFTFIFVSFIFSFSLLFSQETNNKEEIHNIQEKPNIYSLNHILENSNFINHSKNSNKPKYLYYAPVLTGYEKESVEEFRIAFLKPRNKQNLKSALENSLELRLFVRKSIEKENLPPELEYLPVVESYYKTTAKSSSGALGLWQFMANSVKPFLTLNDYVDERLDPWKETSAALKKLRENYNMFGDWLIAIAAYNCGAGAMQRAINKAGVKDFWYLAENNFIPTQTAQYIPKLLAISDLLMHQDYYQMDISLNHEEYISLFNQVNGLFDYVVVTKPYSIKTIANELRIDVSLLEQLNPSFIQGFTHPKMESIIRLPLGTRDAAILALEKIEPLDLPIKYKVQKGDTLWAISKAHNVSVSSICELNNIKENGILSIGKILYIPSKIYR